MIAAGEPGERAPRGRFLERIDHCIRGANLRRTCAIALAVGCVLTAINQGDVLIEGHATAWTGGKIVLNFLVPFVVSNLGVLSASRTHSQSPCE